MTALPMGLPELTTISARWSADTPVLQHRSRRWCIDRVLRDGATDRRIGKAGALCRFLPAILLYLRWAAVARQKWCLSDGIPRDAYFPIPGRNLTILAAAKAPTYPLAYCETEIIRALLSGWLSEYDVVIADAPPLNDDIKTGLPTETLAAAFDCTVLVVLSGETLLV